MKQRASLFCIGIMVFAIGCRGGRETDPVLTNAPYSGLTDSISRSPKAAVLYYRRGTLLYTNNQPALARRDLRRAWELTPNEEYALSLVTALQAASADSAAAFLQQAVEQLPASIALAVALAKIYHDKGETTKALTLCDRIISRYPAQLDALVLKSDLLYEQDQSAGAVALLEKAYVLAPADAAIVHKLAFQYAEAKNPKVLSLTDTLIRYDVQGGRAEPYYFKGLYYENLGNTKEALRFFDEAIQHDYNFIDSYIDKGQLQYAQKSYAAAAQTFRLALRVQPDLAEGYYWLGKTGEAMGAREEARANYERAYALDKTIKKEAAAGAARLR